MSAVEQAQQDAAPAARTREKRALDRLRREPSTIDVVICLVGFATVSALIRAALVTFVHAPTVFSDELVYSKLAESIGRTGHLGLLSERGFSYSPLYPLILSPLYAFRLSAPTTYTVIKLINVLLISFAIVPVYKIARFVLPRRSSLLVAGLSAIAPVFAYSSFVMTENVAYPVCLLSVWAMLVAVRTPSPGRDALVLASIVVAVAARIQLVALFPAAVTAVVLAAALETIETGERGLVRRTIARCWHKHRVLVAVTVLCAGLGAAALSAHRLFSLAGAYSAVGDRGFPNVPHLLALTGRHAAALLFVAGVVPFVGTLVAAYAFVHLHVRRPYIPFAAVATSVTIWLVLEAAFQAAQFDSGPDANIPRIHERFYIYVLPLFLVALVAALRLPREKRYVRAALGAAVVSVVCAAAIPYGTVINNTITFESIGLQMMARVQRGGLTAVPHATLFAVWLTATLALLYWRMSNKAAVVAVLVAIPFLITWTFETDRVRASSEFARSLLPTHTNWIDRAHPAGEVAVISGRYPSTAELESTFANLSISRVYYLCQQIFGSSFGEQPVSLGRQGALRDPHGPLTVQYVVAPASLGIRGRVVARNREGHEVLVAPATWRVRVAPGTTPARVCKAGHRRRT